MTEHDKDPAPTSDARAAATGAEAGSPEPQGGLLKLLLEFGPLIGFLVAQKKWGIMAGIKVFMVAAPLSLIVSYRRERRLAPVPLFTAVFVLVSGGLTLWLGDEQLFMIKTTVMNLMFGALLLFGLRTGRLFLKWFLGEALRLRDEGWNKLTVRWVAWFFFLAALNEVLRRFFSVDTWSNFKAIGIPVLTVVFTLSQMPLIQRFMVEEPVASGEPRAKD